MAMVIKDPIIPLFNYVKKYLDFFFSLLQIMEGNATIRKKLVQREIKTELKHTKQIVIKVDL